LHLPVFLNIAQGKVKQFAGRFVGGEVPAILNDLPQLHVHTLDGIGRVDGLPRGSQAA
jgi:hypothetical protein